MFTKGVRNPVISIWLFSTIGFLLIGVSCFAQMPYGTSAPNVPQSALTPKTPSHADILRGEYGRYRANNDLVFYDLDIRVDPEKKFVTGRNTIRFKMLKDDTRIQLDLYDNLKIEKVVQVFGGHRSNGKIPASLSKPLKYERDSGAVCVDFPETLEDGRTY